MHTLSFLRLPVIFFPMPLNRLPKDSTDSHLFSVEEEGIEDAVVGGRPAADRMALAFGGNDDPRRDFDLPATPSSGGGFHLVSLVTRL